MDSLLYMCWIILREHGNYESKYSTNIHGNYGFSYSTNSHGNYELKFLIKYQGKCYFSWIHKNRYLWTEMNSQYFKSHKVTIWRMILKKNRIIQRRISLLEWTWWIYRVSNIEPLLDLSFIHKATLNQRHIHIYTFILPPIDL